ncbi:M48 family metalloprotease [Thalassobaculum sp. OXR-137]|uniref:M48 family metalloprotease n=1 Tax=Thalassobaculum sp. OXR-137 TaxID=3100173 RepID=UPI002AC91C01|nr:M48 family metalloprotease [Thalassobaculum sp. OXR-137]WPZ34851.1 M48 family metalloprotease [Thalassobaculum sp. OXR-137]
MTAPRVTRYVAALLVAGAALTTVLSTGSAVADPGDDNQTGPVTTREIGRDRLFSVFQSHYGEVKARPEAMRQRLTADRRAMEKEGYVFLDAPKTNKYLNAVLANCLSTVGPRPNLPVTVNLIASYSKTGEPMSTILANRSGLILISVGTLQLLDSPLELGFLLAHEYGHVAMQHPNNSAEFEAMLESDASAGARTAVGAFKHFAGNKSFENMLKRRHEDHADFYGIDAMRECGYNTALAFKVLETIGDWHSETSVFETQRELEARNKSKDQEKEGLGGIFKGLGTAFATGLTALSDSEEHHTRSQTDRRQLLNLYEKEYYKAPKFDMNKMRDALAQWRVFKESTEWAALKKRYGG